MAIRRQSFLSNLIGRNTYDEFSDYAMMVVAIGSCVLVVLFLLSLFLHWGIISYLINLTMGTSLLFVAYVASWVLVLDIEVDVEEPERNSWEKPAKATKSAAYKLSIAWGILLISFGIAAIYFSNKYRRQYAFECSTVLVDHNAVIYHLDYDNDCEIAAEAESLEEMKGYELKNSNYTLCEWCKEWAEQVEAAYEAERYYRR